MTPLRIQKKCHRLVTEQKRWFAEMLFMEATIRPETPFSGDWRVALTLPADRIRRRNEWVAKNQGPPVDHQYIVAFEDDEDPDDLCEWFDESRFDVD
ncbi:hypothetical protein ONZ45_g8581 [Pleurotus djamor]|nr:hypothetical protein ONZ45_g8581 [Pleurotus djamor]